MVNRIKSSYKSNKRTTAFDLASKTDKTSLCIFTRAVSQLKQGLQADCEQPYNEFSHRYVLIRRKTQFSIILPRKGKLLTGLKFSILSLSKFAFLVTGVTQAFLRTSEK